MYDPTSPVSGITGTVRPAGSGMPGATEHSPGTGYACQASADRFHMAMAAHPSLVPHARRMTRQTLTNWQLDHLADDAELIVAELVTNAIRASSAGASVVALYLALDPDRLYMMVWDDCPALPAGPAPADDDSEDGRGLAIVATLSDQYGTAPAGRGKIVWSRIATPAT